MSSGSMFDSESSPLRFMTAPRIVNRASGRSWICKEIKEDIGWAIELEK